MSWSDDEIIQELDIAGVTHGLKPQPIKSDDIRPKPFITQIPLVDVFERLHRVKADKCQIDLCNRLQKAKEEQHIKGSRAIIHIQSQFGKPCSVDSMVLMGDGSYKRLGDINVGEYVISHTGQPRKVLHVFEQGKLDCLRITTHLGVSTVAALDHPFLTPEGWTKVKDLQISQFLANKLEPDCWATTIRKDEEFELAGYFIGDGCATKTKCSIQANITSNDEVQGQRIIEIAKNLGFDCSIFTKKGTEAKTYALKSGIRKWLYDVGIAEKNSFTKVVPDWVFSGTKHQIGLFLGAYLSCDGHVTKNVDRKGNPRATRNIEFYSVSKELLRGVQQLLLRVGVQAKLTKKIGNYKSNQHDSWRLQFHKQDYVVEFSQNVTVAGKKGEQLKSIKVFRRNFKPLIATDQIINIEDAGKIECRCLTVDIDQTFTVDDFIVHNSVIFSQAFPVWIFGHRPTSRFALLTYNETNSQKHSSIAISYMQSAVYKDLFTNKDSWIPNSVSVKRWSTYARMDMHDGQPSYNALGLQSGFTGNSADDVLFDDPYKNLEEALSDTVRPKIESKWLNMTMPRINSYTNIFGMFHRYFHEDFAGYLLSNADWDFDYWRYASICDGDFVDKKTGRSFPDPLKRQPGEYLSHRFSEKEYKNAKQYPQLWASQYQGRPDAEDGGFFDVDKLVELEADAYTQKAKEVVRWVRSWDNAATDAGGAFTVGAKIGITSEQELLIDDLVRQQVSTGKRLTLQLETAEKDGKEVPATVPNDPGGAGTDVVFLTKQKFAEKGFELFEMATQGDKEMRARPLAQEVSAGKVYYKKAWWNEHFKTEFEQFPLSLYKDIVDATADATRFLLKLVEKGNVISYFDQLRTLVSWQSFANKFGKKIPNHWKLYVAIRYNDNKAIPSGAVLIARAADNARLGERLFLVGCYKDSKLDFGELVTWLETFIPAVVEVKNNKLPDMKLILNKEAEHLLPVIRRKLKMSFSLFSGDEVSGIYETNWYMKPVTGKQHPFNPNQLDTSFYWLCAEKQLEKATNEYGLLSARQEANNWTYRDKNKPQEFGGIVLDAVRMILSQFRTSATPLTHSEKFFDYLSQTAPGLMPEIQVNIQDVDRLAEIELARTVVRKEWEQKNKHAGQIESDWGKHVAENEEEGFELL